MPDDYRRPTSAFWREWEAVMLATQATLSRYRSHRIKFTVDTVALSYAARQKKYQHKRKAVDRANDQDRQKVEKWEKFPPLIIPQ